MKLNVQKGEQGEGGHGGAIMLNMAPSLGSQKRGRHMMFLKKKKKKKTYDVF